MLNHTQKNSLRIITQRLKNSSFDFRDCFQIKNLLTLHEKNTKNKACFFGEENLFYEDTLVQNPDKLRHYYRLLGKAGFFGARLQKNFENQLLSIVGAGLVGKELDKIDSLFRSMFGIQNELVIFPIFQYGSVEVKKKYLQSLVDGELVGCFALTEPNFGSDPNALSSTCKFDKKTRTWTLKGSKHWIEWAPLADLFIVWAKDVDDKVLRGFVLDRAMQGVSTWTIEGKLGLKGSLTGSICLESVKVPDSHRLEASGLGSPMSCINNARYNISWGVWGAAEVALNYLINCHENTTLTENSDPPLSSQITQKYLSDIVSEISLSQLACLQVGRLQETDSWAPEMISLLKRNSCMKSLNVTRLVKEALGDSFDSRPIMRFLGNIEGFSAYGGTNDVHALILGRAITNLQAFSRKL